MDINHSALIIDDLTPRDLSLIAWSGGATHLESVAGYLSRVPTGEVEYLAVRAADGQIVAKGGIDYAEHSGAGSITQLAAKVTGQGLGTRLIEAMEQRMRERGVATALCGVESDNPRARALYERLGYRESGAKQASWESEDAGGKRFTKHTTIILLKKSLARAGGS
jgi:ribosomal protein S18 acetylase RimI-like enzyme